MQAAPVNDKSAKSVAPAPTVQLKKRGQQPLLERPPAHMQVTPAHGHPHGHKMGNAGDEDKRRQLTGALGVGKPTQGGKLSAAKMASVAAEKLQSQSRNNAQMSQGYLGQTVSRTSVGNVNDNAKSSHDETTVAAAPTIRAKAASQEPKAWGPDSRLTDTLHNNSNTHKQSAVKHDSSPPSKPAATPVVTESKKEKKSKKSQKAEEGSGGSAGIVAPKDKANEPVKEEKKKNRWVAPSLDSLLAFDSKGVPEYLQGVVGADLLSTLMGSMELVRRNEENVTALEKEVESARQDVGAFENKLRAFLSQGISA